MQRYLRKVKKYPCNLTGQVQKCLLFLREHIIINKLAEMSEWFKEHDWKSCDGGDSSGGSNPLLCATESPLLAGFFCAQRRAQKFRHSAEVRARRRNEHFFSSVSPLFADDALPQAAISSRHRKPAFGGLFLCAEKSSEVQAFCGGSREEAKRYRDRIPNGLISALSL